MEIIDFDQYKKKFNNGNFFSSYSQFIVYGAGNTGHEVKSVLNRYGINPKCFLDINAGNKTAIDNIPVYCPDNPEVINSISADTVVILAIYNSGVDIMELHRKLTCIGYTHIINFIEFYYMFVDEFDPKYWLTNLDLYNGLDNIICSTSDLFADKISSELFASIIKFRMSGDFSLLPDPDIINQYFPPDLINLKINTFIDCGAYDGDSIINLNKRFGKIDTIVAFEPDLNNFRKLKQVIRSEQYSNHCFLYPCGVWSETEQVVFNSNNNASSNITDAGNTTIQCISLDDILENENPDFIKMDIEGAEYSALIGAYKIINRYMPVLAISIYHKPEDLWLIPNLIKSWHLNYRLFIRLHGFSIFDVVMYGIPEHL